MIRLSFTVDNISAIIRFYDQIQIQRSDTETGTFTTVSGLGPIDLVAGTTIYTEIDADGTASDWYHSRYYNTSTTIPSGWSDAILGEPGDLFYDPLFPPEVSYGTAQQLVIDRIRRLIGDPLGLEREYGEDAASSIHPDNKTYELDEKGWPVSIFMNNVSYNTSTNPTINGYRYLIFDDDISVTATISGVEYGVNIFYYTFRWSDREIMESYDGCPVPTGLSLTTATSESYMLQTSIELLYSEVWELSSEDGARVRDSDTLYDPSPGLETKRVLLDKLQKRLDDLVKSLVMTGIEGVLID